MRPALGGLCLLAFSVAGCGGSAPKKPALSIDGFVEGLAEAACRWQLSCCSPIELEISPTTGYATKDECLPFARLELEQASADVRASLRAGDVTFDAAAASACLERASLRACTPRPGPASEGLSFGPWLYSCRAAFVGRRGAGSPCPTGLECGAGTLCRPDEGFEPTIACHRATEAEICSSKAVWASVYPGLVEPPCAENTVCGEDPACLSYPRDGEPCLGVPPFCDPDPALALTCVGMGFNGLGVCATAGGGGDACGAPGLPPCAASLTCNGPVGTIGTCGPPPEAGDSCTADGACASPNRCDLLARRCTPPGPRAEGEPCDGPADCASVICRLWPEGPAGEPPRTRCTQVGFGAPVCVGANVNAGASGSVVGVDAGADASFDARRDRPASVVDAGAPDAD